MRMIVPFSAFLLGCYLLLMPPFTHYLGQKSIEEKLGYLPRQEVILGVSGEHRHLFAAYLMMQIIYYFGGILEVRGDQQQTPVDYSTMARYVRTANFLDPYNADLYYFSQAAFAQGENGTRFVNGLLRNGMKYRTWDPELPFFAGFNAAFTLKNYREAAEYMKRAGELSGEPLYSSLAVKFFNEAGETDFGILFMESMEKSATDEKMRRLYRNKRNMLVAAREIKRAADRYRQGTGKYPDNLAALVSAGLLARVPQDPFGGKFFLTPDGRVETTSGGLTLKAD